MRQAFKKAFQNFKGVVDGNNESVSMSGGMLPPSPSPNSSTWNKIEMNVGGTWCLSQPRLGSQDDIALIKITPLQSLTACHFHPFPPGIFSYLPWY